MRFDFLGNNDCPEWVLAEISLVNKMSTVKLRLILGQIVKKLLGQPYDQEKMAKMCKDQKFDSEETRCLLAILEFVMSQAAKHDVADTVFSKDLLQMGVAIENSNGMVKAFNENQEQLVKAQINQSMRISSIDSVNYKLSYLMSSSMTGKNLLETEEGLFQEPIDVQVTLNVGLNQFPTNRITASNKNIKFCTTRDKFLQLTKDMQDAVEIMENMKSF